MHMLSRYYSPTRARILLLAATSASVLASVGPAVVKAATPDPQVIIQTMLQSQQDAWNKNDSTAYSAVFSDDVDFINIRGQIYNGKSAVIQLHTQIFAGPFKGSTISIVLRRFKLLAPTAALVDTDQTVTGYTGLPPGIVATSTGVLLTHFKYIALEQPDGSWKFISGQNTASLPL